MSSPSVALANAYKSFFESHPEFTEQNLTFINQQNNQLVIKYYWLVERIPISKSPKIM